MIPMWLFTRHCSKLLSVAALFYGIFSEASAQTTPAIENLEFPEKTDFRKHEARILEMANYVLSRPLSDDHPEKVALANIVKWMSGTPDHDFVIDKTVMDLARNNENVLGLYMAAAAKAALQGNAKTAAELKLTSFEILLDYCANASNGVKANKEMKKALAARENGKLNQYLNL